MCRTKKFVLAVGPRFCGKTISCIHAFVENAWLTPRGNSCIITISQTVGVDSGIWKDLTDVVLPHWINGNFGLQWIRRPYIIGTTKKPTCEIANYKSLEIADPDWEEKDYQDHADELRSAGATSVMQLESLKVEDEAEDRFKPRRYSCIYVPELSTFHKQKTFVTWSECLRLLGLPADKHLLLCDTNPADSGSDSWIYKMWFDLLNTESEDATPELRGLRDMLGRIDFTIADNVWDTPERIEELKAKYYHDPDLYARYILGEWVTASEDALFYTTYRPTVHEVGEVETKSNPDPAIMVPEEGCFELLGGWDLGVSNSAFVIAEKAYRFDGVIASKPDQFQQQSLSEASRALGRGDKPQVKIVPFLKFLDELVITGEVFSMEDFAVECLKKMLWWETFLDRKVIWKHWSDRSAFDYVEPVTNRYHHQIVFDATGGVIVLNAAEKGPGSVLQRVDMWKKFLFDERLYFSKAKCPKMITMNKSIKRGSSSIQLISKGSVHKHPWDAGSYIAASEFPNELQQNIVQRILAQRRQSEGSLVSVAY